MITHSVFFLVPITIILISIIKEHSFNTHLTHGNELNRLSIRNRCLSGVLMINTFKCTDQIDKEVNEGKDWLLIFLLDLSILRITKYAFRISFNMKIKAIHAALNSSIVSTPNDADTFIHSIPNQ